MEETVVTTEEVEVTEANAAPASAPVTPTTDAEWENAPAEAHLSAAESILAEIGSLCAVSTSAYTNPQHEPSYAQIADTLGKRVQKYNWHSKLAALKTCAESGSPMFKAVELLEYNVTSVTEKSVKAGESSIKFFAHKEKAKRLDLTEVFAYCKARDIECGTLDWYRTLEKLNCVLTLEHARLLGIPEDKIAIIDASFLMTKTAREVQLAATDPSAPNPLSKTQISKNLTLILTQLVEDAYHADTRDAAFLRMIFAGQGRESLSVKTANTKRLCDVLIQIAHRSCFDKAYTILAPTHKERRA